MYQDDVAVADSSNTLTGQYAVHHIQLRPRTAHAAYPAVALFFPEAVELCLRKISGSLAVIAGQFFSRSCSFRRWHSAVVNLPNQSLYPAHARHAESPAYRQSLGEWNKLPPTLGHTHPDFPESYGLPADGLRGKRVFLVILFTSFSGSSVSRIPWAVQMLRGIAPMTCWLMKLPWSFAMGKPHYMAKGSRLNVSVT